jgi:hypothetical protein
MCRRKRAARSGGTGAGEKQLGEALQRGQRRAELVRDHGEELGLGPVDLAQPARGGGHLVFQLPGEAPLAHGEPRVLHTQRQVQRDLGRGGIGARGHLPPPLQREHTHGARARVHGQDEATLRRRRRGSGQREPAVGGEIRAPHRPGRCQRPIGRRARRQPRARRRAAQRRRLPRGAHENSNARGLQSAAHHRRHPVEPDGQRRFARQALLDLEQGGEAAGAGPTLVPQHSRDDADGRRQDQRHQPLHRGAGQSRALDGGQHQRHLEEAGHETEEAAGARASAERRPRHRDQIEMAERRHRRPLLPRPAPR